jgi:hypothetical protein
MLNHRSGEGQRAIDLPQPAPLAGLVIALFDMNVG